MLRAGGTKRHKELLAPFGLDASDPAFWDKGLGVIAGFIDELEAALSDAAARERRRDNSLGRAACGATPGSAPRSAGWRRGSRASAISGCSSTAASMRPSCGRRSAGSRGR